MIIIAPAVKFLNTDKHEFFKNFSVESVSICVLYLCVSVCICVYLWFSISGFFVRAIIIFCLVKTVRSEQIRVAKKILSQDALTFKQIRVVSWKSNGFLNRFVSASTLFATRPNPSRGRESLDSARRRTPCRHALES